MKKSSIALATGLLAAGAAQAGVFAGSTGATGMALNPNGIGHQLVIPYYTVQGNNATLINIVNHDQVNGKAVKVRFRGAANSDDVYDFTLLLSPGDVWTAAITQDASGAARLTTSDNSCTLPQSGVNRTFILTRLDPHNPKRTLQEQTREGYVEIINMADIPKNTASGSLWSSIKHGSNGKPANCNSDAVAALNDDVLIEASDANTFRTRGLDNPTTGLSADWIIINQQTTAAWSGSATAIEAVAGTVTTTGHIVFFPQTASAAGISSTTASNYTADPLLAGGLVKAQSFDFPDLSTPYYGTSATTAGAQRATTTTILAKTVVANEYLTDPTIAGLTDLVLSQPMRRYFVAVNYKGGSNNTTAVQVPASGVPAPYGAANMSLVDRVLCLAAPSGSQFLTFTLYDREEQNDSGSKAVVSPGDDNFFRLCGEVAVTSINAGTTPSSLAASLTRNDIMSPFKDGWIEINTQPTSSSGGLPIIGNAHLRAANGQVNYGFTWPHKYNYSNK
jgi:hypothetical protein